jgi:FtsZ-binding cell division protein ZapB
MKKYTELSGGKWIVSGEDENGTNEFLLVPRMKGSVASGTPILTCDSPSVTTTWNDSCFIVKIPEANSTYNFTLTWGNLTRGFQFIVSENLLDDVSTLQGEITTLQGKNAELTNVIQDTSSKIDTLKASTVSNCNEIKTSLDNTTASLNGEIDTTRSNYIESTRNVKNLFEALKNTMEQLRDSRASNAVYIRKQAEQYANSTSPGLTGMYTQLTTTASFVDREAIMYAYFLDNFINGGVDALNSSFI